MKARDAIREAFDEGFALSKFGGPIEMAWQRSEACHAAAMAREPLPPALGRHDPATCPHEGFRATVDVNRLEDVAAFIADVRIACLQCDEAFRFLGVPAGVRFDGPAVSIDELELRAPIEPEGDKRLQASAQFQMPERLKAN